VRVHLLQNTVQCSIGSTDITKYIILFILCIVTFVIYVYQHMHTNFAKLRTIHMRGLLYVSVTNCLPQRDVITEEYIILIIQIYVYSARNKYNSSFKYNNVDIVYSMMLAFCLLKLNDMPLFAVYVVVLQTSSSKFYVHVTVHHNKFLNNKTN
jgi:hypothetical protein